MHDFTRRRFNAGLAGAAALPLALGGLSRRAMAETRLRLYWWGNPDRDKRTFAVVDLYKEKQPDVQVDAEAVQWSDYWTKMATQAAGRNMADVVQMDYRYLYEYARRQQLEPLDDYLGGDLDLSHFEPSFLDSGRYEGVLYAIPWTVNSIACYYDHVSLQEYGVAMPDWRGPGTTSRGSRAEIKKKAPEGYGPRRRQGHLGADASSSSCGSAARPSIPRRARSPSPRRTSPTISGLWGGMRQEGLVPAPDVTTRDIGGLDQTPIVGRKSVIDFAHSNQVIGTAGAGPERARHDHAAQPEGRHSGPVSQALHADLGEQDQREQGGGDQARRLPRLRPRRRCDPAASSAACRATSARASSCSTRSSPTERKMIDYLDDRRRQRLALAAAAAQRCGRGRDAAAPLLSRARFRPHGRARRVRSSSSSRPRPSSAAPEP